MLRYQLEGVKCKLHRVQYLLIRDGETRTRQSLENRKCQLPWGGCHDSIADGALLRCVAHPVTETKRASCVIEPFWFYSVYG